MSYWQDSLPMDSTEFKNRVGPDCADCLILQGVCLLWKSLFTIPEDATTHQLIMQLPHKGNAGLKYLEDRYSKHAFEADEIASSVNSGNMAAFVFMIQHAHPLAGRSTSVTDAAIKKGNLDMLTLARKLGYNAKPTHHDLFATIQQENFYIPSPLMHTSNVY